MRNNIILLLIVLVMACGGTQPATVIPAAEVPEAVLADEFMPPKPAKVGDLVIANDISLTVKEVVVDGTKVSALISIKNLGQRSAGYNLLYFTVKNSEGFEFGPSISGKTPLFGSGDLVPGDIVTGWVTFKDAGQGLVLSYEPIVLLADFTPIKVNLGI